MINCLQIIVLLPLLDTSMPPNAGMFFEELTKIAAFDILEIGEYFDFGEFVNDLLDLVPSDPINYKFETIGLETLFFINNMGSFYLVILLEVALIPIWLLFVSFGRRVKFFKKQGKSLGKRLFCNTCITTIFETFMIVALCALITVKFAFEMEEAGENVQTLSALATFTIYFTVPVIVSLLLLYRFKSANDPQMLHRVGAFYSNLNYRSSGRKVLLQPVSFLVRRLHMAWLVIQGSRILWYQISQVMAVTVFVVLLPYWLNSYKSREERKQHSESELVILSIASCFLIFNVVSVDSNYIMGYLAIGIVSAYVGIALILVIILTIRQVRRKLKTWHAKRAYRKTRT